MTPSGAMTLSGGMSCVSLTTDYGLADGFVAACHGVLLRRAPGVPIVDVTHLVPRGDVRRGALVLAQTVGHLPRGVHVAVVDPGVGTARRGLAALTPGGFLVGPDNGLLLAAADVLGGVLAAVDLTVAPGTPATFHGRDVFAPAAAALVTGAGLADLGEPVEPRTLVRLPAPVARVLAGPSGPRLAAEVVLVDGFGNVALAAPAARLAEVGLAAGARARLTFERSTPGPRSASAGPPPDSSPDSSAGPPPAGVELAVGVTFGSVEPGELVLYPDSAGLVAIARRDGDAARRLLLRPGDQVLVDPA